MEHLEPLPLQTSGHSVFSSAKTSITFQTTANKERRLIKQNAFFSLIFLASPSLVVLLGNNSRFYSA
jgi:hypothetical protein